MRTPHLLPAAALVLGACVPHTWSYAHAVVIPLDGRDHDAATVELPLAELASRLAEFEPERLAFYVHGRLPVPHALIDRDGDGLPDHARLHVPIAAAGTGVTVTCPGPPAAAGPVPGGPVTAVRIEHR